MTTPIDVVARLGWARGLNIVCLLGGLSACEAASPSSRTTDIFQQDGGDAENGSARRRPAAADEALWTIYMGGCTGHLIAPDYMMTANHCQAQAGAVYSSGAALTQHQRDDITVTQVVEADPSLDYAILKIRWTGTRPAAQRFPPLVATRPTDVQMGAGATEGDELFTVGFPQDKVDSWGATYAEGRAKTAADNRLLYNIGIINGNSGGGVWRKKDRMLVSLTNGGPRIFGQSGWDTGDMNDPNNWNFGVAMWNVYANSRTLQDLFPGGKSRFATGEDPTGAAAAFLALGLPTAGAADSFELALSAPKAAAKLVYCETATPAACRPGAAGYAVARLVRTADAMVVFKGAAPLALSDGLSLSLVALDSQDRPVAQRTLRFEAHH